MKKTYILILSLIFTSCLFSLIALEIGVRLYVKLQAEKPGINRVEHYARSWPLMKGIEDKKYFYELKPQINKTLEGLNYQTNDKGLRDNKAVFKKDPRSYNILIIGCSQTFGTGLNYEDTYGYRLEKRLNQFYGDQGQSFRVWNGGVPGYSLDQIIGAFEQKTFSLKPDLLILGFFIDTLVRPNWHFKGGILYEPRKGYLLQQLFSKSRLISFVLFRLKNQKFNPYNYYQGYYGTVNNRWHYAMDKVQYLNSLCKERGIKFVVADLPTLFWKGPLKKEDWIEYPLNLKAEAMCNKEGISYNNALLPFEGYEAGPLWAIPGFDCHYGVKAADLVSESIFNKLTEMNLIKK